MKPETEQLLGTLEVLLWHPSRIFVWETEVQGELNVWNLAIAQGFVSLTDVDVAIAHWQSVERWGTPTDQSKNDYEYAPPRNEREDEWNAEIEAKRFESYQQLSQLIKAELRDLQAFRLSIPKVNDSYFDRHRPNYCFYIIIGKTDDGNWLCLSQTVPDQVSYRRSKERKFELAEATDIKLDLQSKIHSIISELPPITLYGYYYGDYNYTYEHQIVYAIANKKAVAIKVALQSAGMLIVEKTNVGYRSKEYNHIPKLNEFFNTKLGEKAIYNLSFWDIGYYYEIGQTPTGDWLGVRSLLEFEYNP
ncbi:hypothetical protein H6S82_20995 [Planktothrix sp. FACHB-1355]|uniref:Uncharacterized protein n=1 Tax=Aerosakkonema funiforme FACHB-1375 TaxID=2949571 RepID=A0A926ZJZ9_9CYAN|nr:MULTISPECIES: hypothetical protein [Oscillatoriales]MBD2184852.1 hypothetical protein [Aerosakkonema funiforme FACHB-1375]MBD3561298.1 hypothetical protein [Planktothrix sp. FACHB-1355]